MESYRQRLKFVTAAVLFGTNGIVAAHISLSSAETVLLRTMLGLVFLAAAVVLTGRFDFAALKRDAAAATLGGAALGLNWVLLFAAYRETSVSMATLIYNCGPMLVLALSPVLFGERLTRGKLAAVAAVTAGLLCISGSIDLHTRAAGFLLAGGAALFYAAMIVCNKRVTALSGLHCALYELIVSFVVVLAYVLFTGGRVPVPVAAGEWAPVLWLGIVNTSVTYYLYFSSMQKLPGQTVSLLCYLDPLTALVLSALLLHERLAPVQILGAALILGGALLGDAPFVRRRLFSH